MVPQPKPIFPSFKVFTHLRPTFRSVRKLVLKKKTKLALLDNCVSRTYSFSISVFYLPGQDLLALSQQIREFAKILTSISRLLPMLPSSRALVHSVPKPVSACSQGQGSSETPPHSFLFLPPALSTQGQSNVLKLGPVLCEADEVK